MVANRTRLGIDVGGSHISAALLHQTDQGWNPSYKTRISLDSNDSAYSIIAALSDCIKALAGRVPVIESVGIAFPGPFDYERGVSTIYGNGGKFEKAFGLHIKQGVNDFAGLPDGKITFSNDAHCFAVGAAHLQGLKGRRTIFLTLGTGLGSAFMMDGALVQSHPELPLSGALFDQDFLLGIADDYFSTRWIKNAYYLRTGTEIASVKDLAEGGTEHAQAILAEFGANLGRFLFPWLERYDCDELIIGGNIAKASSLFLPALKEVLRGLATPVNLVITDDTEHCIITGAVLVADESYVTNRKQSMRKTLQDLLPVTASTNGSTVYDIYPSFPSGKTIAKGFDSLAAAIANEKLLIIDGYGGVLWDEFREQLHQQLSALNKRVFWYDVRSCMRPTSHIRDLIADSLNGDDPVFGKRYAGNLADFFDADKLNLIAPDPTADLCIIYGTGAALTGIDARLIYVDVPKNEIQFRMRAGSITNLGSDEIVDPSQMYKRFYFVDWPVLNKHKASLLSRIDYIVDEQRIHQITWMDGESFRNTLAQLVQQPFRARPWFEPGVWGGDWMKNHFPQLKQDEINYAWSFELITPENGIVLEGSNNLLEVSFDFLLYLDNKKLLGKAAHRFGTEFPIRFDFLDTFHGGNLSVQCHPRPAYAREHFGENFTQDETYYILDCAPDASVYLGFRDPIDPDAFKTALIDAQEEGIEVDVEKYIQKLPAHKHDLFLIPNGTIHASGKNNLVLEISSTPYIFTFKKYDWLRPGLSGQPRPINIEHAMNNLYFDRKGDYVTEKLLSHPVIEAEWEEGRNVKLPTHEEHFYRINRYEFTGSLDIETNDQCHICMLVQGTRVRVEAHGTVTEFHYAETFVIPAATGQYRITAMGPGKAFFVVAQVKDDHC